MQAKRDNEPKFNLTVNAREANWLREWCRNPFEAKESEEDTEMRDRFFTAIERVLPVASGLMGWDPRGEAEESAQAVDEEVGLPASRVAALGVIVKSGWSISIRYNEEAEGFVATVGGKEWNPYELLGELLEDIALPRPTGKSRKNAYTETAAERSLVAAKFKKRAELAGKLIESLTAEWKARNSVPNRVWWGAEWNRFILGKLDQPPMWPKTVRLTKTVRSNTGLAVGFEGEVFSSVSNARGVVSMILTSSLRFVVKSYQYEVETWSETRLY